MRERGREDEREEKIRKAAINHNFLTISSFYNFLRYTILSFKKSSTPASNGFLQRAKNERTFEAHGERWRRKRPLTSPAIYILIKRCLSKCGESKSGKLIHVCSYVTFHLQSPHNEIIQTWSHYDNGKYFIFICSTLSFQCRKCVYEIQWGENGFHVEIAIRKPSASLYFCYETTWCAMKYEMFIKTL